MQMRFMSILYEGSNKKSYIMETVDIRSAELVLLHMFK